MKRLKTSDSDYLTQVLKVLNLIVKSLEHYQRTKKPLKDEYFKLTESSYLCKHHPKSLGKICVELTTKSICSQRYEETSKLLWLVCQDLAVYDSFVYKATMIVLESILPDNDDVMLQLTNDLQCLKHINKKESQLEYIIYGLKNNISSLLSKVEAIASKTKTKYLRKHPVIDAMFDAYYTYLKYEENRNLTVGEFGDAKFDSNDVMAKFKTLIDVPGDWDVFVIKLIELMEIADLREEIEEVLLKYAKNNPYNLNALIYLCEYQNSWNSQSEILIGNLQKLFDLCPSDPRIMLLVEKLYPRSENTLYCLRVIFMFLDYPSNGINLKAWTMLVTLLSNLKSRDMKTEKRSLKALWKTRNFWNWLYFNVSKIHSDACEDYQLVCCKYNALTYLQNDHEYVAAVETRYPEIAYKCKE